MAKISANGSVVSGHVAPSVSHHYMIRIFTDGRSVSGKVAQSAVLRLYEFLNFDTVLYQFLKTRTSSRRNIGCDQLITFLGFSLLPFTLTVPLRPIQ